MGHLGGEVLWAGQFPRVMGGSIIPTISGKGQRVSRNWVTAHFLAFNGLRTVGVTFS